MQINEDISHRPLSKQVMRGRQQKHSSWIATWLSGLQKYDHVNELNCPVCWQFKQKLLVQKMLSNVTAVYNMLSSRQNKARIFFCFN